MVLQVGFDADQGAVVTLGIFEMHECCNIDEDWIDVHSTQDGVLLIGGPLHLKILLWEYQSSRQH